MTASAPRRQIRYGVFWQLERPEPGDAFVYQGRRYVVDSVQSDPACGYEVRATPQLETEGAR